MGSRKTKKQLLDAAATVFARNPGATLHEVAEFADIGRATLYRYFKNREALLRALTIEAYQSGESAIKAVFNKKLSAGESLRKYIEVLVPQGNRYHFLVTSPPFDDDSRIAKYRRRETKFMENFVKFLKNDGVVASDIPTAWITATIEGLIYTAWATVNYGYVAQRDAVNLVYTTLLQGVSP